MDAGRAAEVLADADDYGLTRKISPPSRFGLPAGSR